MIVLVDTTLEGDCALLLKNMFAARKRVFVDLLRWNVPVLDDRFEVDEFDDKHARYLILTDETLRHLASVRLLPTERPHLLDTLFPALCAGPVPKGPAIYEITRFCLDRDLSASDRRALRNRMVSALADHGLAHGIGMYTGVAESGWLAQILAFGWDARPLGQGMAHCGRRIGALAIRISQETPGLLAATGVWAPTECMVAARSGHARAQVLS